ncbi:hypothetical protein PYW07_016996 [Mythimna separata]|uniref:Uncharacterized protein n=1 Tax=Mythimna separata TaxID=271217 RepID=A0AAD7YVU8_MYTSE|nr:hypothetical protein PYW07_016996 [Mythimna separata]
MDGRGRRNRRRAYSCFSPRPRPQPWSFIDSLISIFILSGLLGVIYLMLEQHFSMCNPSCDLNNINKSLADIAKNIANMKDGYRELELQIIRFSQELPKIEGQVELIEALTYAIEKKEAGWNPRKCMPLPNVDVFLHNPPRKVAKNITCNKNDCPKRLLKSTV